MRSLNDYFLTVSVPLGTATQVYLPIPDNGKVIKVVSVLNGALTTANEVLTVKNGSGTSMGTITLTQSGSAAGDIDTLSPTANNSVLDGSFIEIETDGGNASAVSATVTVIVRR